MQNKRYIAGVNRHWVWLGIIVAVGGWLRFYGMSAKSLWFDETLSWQLIQFPLPEMIERTGEPYTVHPPAYFWFLRLWVSFWGDSELGLRSLSGVAGLATIVGAYFLLLELRRLPGSQSIITADAALLAALFPAIGVLPIHLSQQVRGYALGSALYIFASLFLLRALRSGQWIDWLTSAGLVLLFCYTHHLAFAQLAAWILFALAYLGRQLYLYYKETPAEEKTTPNPWKQLDWMVICGVVVGLGYCPWLYYLLAQIATASQAWKTSTNLNTIAEQTFLALTASFAQGHPTISPWITMLVSAGLILGLLFLVWRGGWAGVFLCLAGLIPPILLIIQSNMGARGIYLVRYLSFPQLVWLLALATLVGMVPFTTERRLLGLLFSIWAVFWCSQSWSTIGPQAQPGIRAAAQYILAEHTSEEPIVARTSFILFGTAYYMRDQATPLLCGPAKDRLQYRNASQLREEDIITTRELSELKTPGIWIITTNSFSPSQQHWFPIPETWRLQSTKEFPQGDYLFEKPITVEHYIIEKMPIPNARVTPK